MDVLTIRSDGRVEGLFTEAIVLGELGPLTVTRASTIEFNPAAQQWEVQDMDGQILFANASRKTCLTWEHSHFNTLMLPPSLKTTILPPYPPMT